MTELIFMLILFLMPGGPTILIINDLCNQNELCNYENRIGYVNYHNQLEDQKVENDPSYIPNYLSKPGMEVTLKMNDSEYEEIMEMAVRDGGDKLTVWEIDFIESLSNQDFRHLTERQQCVLSNIGVKLGVR